MTPDLEYCWRGDITDVELVALTKSYGGIPEIGWWDRIRSYSFGWVTARLGNGAAAGFVNVAWDGGEHAFLVDTKVRSDLQRHGIGTELVRIAVEQAKRAGCEWLHSTTTTNSRPSTSAPATFARPRPRSSTFPTWTPTEPLEPTHDGIEAHNSERGLTITPGTCVPRCYGDALEVDWTVAGLHEAQARAAP